MLEPKSLCKSNFLSSLDLNCSETLAILELATQFKKKDLKVKFDNKVLGLVFDKASTSSNS